LLDINYYVAAISSKTGLIRIIDLANGVTIREIQMSNSDIEGMAFSPDRTTIVSIDKESMLRFWDLQDETVTHEFNLGIQKATGPLVFSSDGLKLALTDIYQNNTYEFDLQKGTLKGITDTAGYGNKYGWYSYTPNNHLMTWGQDPDNIFLKDLSGNGVVSLLFGFNGDSSSVEAFALSYDENFLATGHVGADILIWNLNNRKLAQTLHGHEMRGGDGWSGGIHHLAFSPQNDLLVSIGYDGTTRLWNIHSGLQLQKLNVCCYAELSPDGRILVTLGEGVLRVWGVPPWP
jgi:WD40 repeat protein